jgi:hypothetical protein
VVSRAARIFLSGLIALAGAVSLPAKNLADYRAGDIAETDIVTPVALEVVNPATTAARKAAEALKIPAIFCDFPRVATNAIAADFNLAFATTHTQFLAALAENFSKPVLEDSNILTPDFTNWVGTFNRQSRAFPVPAELAAEWARGGDGAATQTQWLGRLLRMMHRPVYAGDLPAGFLIGDTLRFVPVSRPDETPPLAALAESSKLIPATNLTSLARVQMLFRHSFPKSEQPLASSLAAFLLPDCVPSPALTAAAREVATRDLVVTDHYAPGQIIVARGAVIDEAILPALQQLAEKSPPPNPVAAVIVKNMPPPVSVRRHWIVPWLMSVALFASTVIFLAWRRRAARKNSWQLPVRTAEVSSVSPTAPLTTNPVVRIALAQELAAQRAKLLSSQQAVTAELAELAHRLEAAQTPMVEKLRAYEQRIQELETELGAQTRENRELLRLKIEMIRSQLEIERNRVNFN